MTIKSQIHNRFALFTSTPDETGLVPTTLADAVANFAASNQNIAIKSVGIEYLEHDKQLILSLGYAEGQAGYPVKLQCASLGKFGATQLGEIAAAMEKAASQIGEVICHEFYVREDNEFFLVMLVHG
jgi:hypothetical protein